MDRPAWVETWMEIAETAAKRSICLKLQVGAVLTKGNKILSLGYNGPPKGMVHCSEVGCAKDKGGRCRGAHSEMNIIVNAANQGVEVKGAELTCTWRPCLECSKHLINAEISRIIYKHDYPKDEEAVPMLRSAGIEVFRFDYFVKNLRVTQPLVKNSERSKK